MFLNQLIDLIETRIAPKEFQLSSEIYGLQYGKRDSCKIIKKVLLTIDLTLEAIHFGLKNKVNLIIAHHGLFNVSIKYFNQSLINKLSLLTRFPISLFILNSSFIAAEGGISDTILETLYLELDRTFNIKTQNGKKIPIGRICLPKSYLNQNKELNLEDLIKRIKINMELNCVFYIGNLKKKINKICIVGGDTPNRHYINKALKYGCDCYISGRLNYFDAIYARDNNLNVIEISHYKNEFIALRKLGNLLSLEFPYVEFMLFDSKDPYCVYF
jgi:dinuclear metal center YbgI/SA1388 family protein